MNQHEATELTGSIRYNLQKVELELVLALEKIEDLEKENKRLTFKLWAAEKQLDHLLGNTNEHN